MVEKVKDGQKQVKCMNHDPENSKWGEYAPEGGCKELMWIDIRSDRGLCWRCTSNSVNMKTGGYADTRDSIGD
jgi:hypothetical protein